MVTFLIALALHGSAPPPRTAIYSSRGRDVGYVHRLIQRGCVLAEWGFVCPMPAPLPPPAHHHRRRSK